MPQHTITIATLLNRLDNSPSSEYFSMGVEKKDWEHPDVKRYIDKANRLIKVANGDSNTVIKILKQITL